jgi:hypothetical protein
MFLKCNHRVNTFIFELKELALQTEYLFLCLLLSPLSIIELFAKTYFFFSNSSEKIESLKIIITLFASNSDNFVSNFLNKVEELF